MRRFFLTKYARCFRVLMVAAVWLIALPSRQAHAADSLDVYVGGAIGQSRVEATGQQIYAGGQVYNDTGRFKENHSAFKVMVGIRPISLLGAELAYTDYGHPSGSFGAYPADVTMKGGSAFGVLYLPIPVIDFFVKAGLARIQSDVNGTGYFGPNCSPTGPCPLYVGVAPFKLERTDTGFTSGAGAQYRFGLWAVRAEYERFNAAGEHPSLLSLGFTWKFF